MLKQGPAPGKGYQAHHGLPWKNKSFFDRVGLNINDPKYGRWVRSLGNGGHQSWSKRYGALWDVFEAYNSNATAEEIIIYFNKLNGIK